MAGIVHRLSFWRRPVPHTARPIVWPPIEQELKGYLPRFTGEVLNAGAGNRDLSPYIPGRLTNQDLATGIHNANIHIYSPLHEIPRPDGFFDAIICNAVLEHVQNPDEVLEEFHRVLKDGGLLFLAVPFMQPEHKDPADFQRYTKDGLRVLLQKHGFEVEKIEGVHTVYHTLGWILHLWLTAELSFRNWCLRQILYPLLRWRQRNSKRYVDPIASAYRALAHKRARR